MKSNFVQRTITGSLYVATVVLALMIGQFGFFALLLIVNFLCLFEFYELVLPDKRPVEKYLGIIAGCIILLMFDLIFSADLSTNWYYHIVPVFLFMFIIKLFEKTHNEFSTLAFQVLGIVYITLPIVMLSKIGFFSSLDYDGGLPLGFFILLWTSDTGAYLAGKKFGKHKLFERISPKKTVEGFVGAIILGLLVAFGLSKIEFFDLADTIDWLIISVIIVVFGTLGDLFESLLKRNLHIKDSGTILPGHGGVLDRFDGLFLAVPAMFFYLLFTN